MKCEIKEKRPITGNYYFLFVKLVPENIEEKAAIENVINMKASQVERELIENALLFISPSYSVLATESSVNAGTYAVFKLKATRL